MEIRFIEPKNKRAEKVDWKISERVRSIVKFYAEYAEYTEEDLVDEFLLNILNDKKFLKWVEAKRYNKRILSQMFDIEEDESIG